MGMGVCLDISQFYGIETYREKEIHIHSYIILLKKILLATCCIPYEFIEKWISHSTVANNTICSHRFIYIYRKYVF